MNIDLIRNILNILFMALALAAVITYFMASDFKVFIYVSDQIDIHTVLFY